MSDDAYSLTNVLFSVTLLIISQCLPAKAADLKSLDSPCLNMSESSLDSRRRLCEGLNCDASIQEDCNDALRCMLSYRFGPNTLHLCTDVVWLAGSPTSIRSPGCPPCPNNAVLHIPRADLVQQCANFVCDVVHHVFLSVSLYQT